MMPAIRPQRVSLMEKIASSLATTTSHAAAMPVPPPKQPPWISASVGTGQVSSRRTASAVSRLTAEAVRRLDTCPVPTLALIQGGCFGGGTGIAAACDVVVASEDAIFSISETRWGLMAGIILPQLCQAIGLRQVRRYALTGERFGAQEARRLGLVHEVCPTGGLEEAGNRIVEAVLMNAPAATTATKLRSLASARAFVDDGELRDLIDEHARTRQQAEATEGLASFREKRKPSWYPG